MILRYVDNTPEGIKRQEKIKEILPKEPLFESMIRPKLDMLYPVLLKALYKELEIYREYPKIPLESIEKAKNELKTFEPRNSRTCFQGKGFRSNENYTDGDLHNYRKAIGTYNHAEWGDCTLMEIWAGDHYKDHKKMVVSAFKYGAGLIKKRPVLKFHVNPLFKNHKSGRLVLTDDQKEYKENMDLLLAKAIAFGVKEKPRNRK